MHAIFFNPPLENYYIGHQFSEIYKDKIYEPILKGQKDLTILDIGANIGITSYYFSQFAKKIISVEPSKEHFKILTKVIEYNQLKNIEAVNKAIYMNEEELPLYKNTNKTMFSLHGAVHDGSEQPEMVQTTTIEKLIEKIDKVDLMKIDIEGSETEVLSHPSFQDIAHKIDKVITERHAWSGRQPQQLLDALKMAGYKIDTIPSSADIIYAHR